MSAEALRPHQALRPAHGPNQARGDGRARLVRETFTAQGYTIDVRLEPDPSPRGARVAGQVLDISGNPTPVSAIPVLLVAGGEVVGQAMTCPAGEFLAVDLPKDSLELYVMVDPANCIQMPLYTAQAPGVSPAPGASPAPGVSPEPTILN